MGRKKKPDAEPANEGASATTKVIRVEADLARMLSIISTATGQDVTDIASPILRPGVTKLYAETLKQLGQEVKE